MTTVSIVCPSHNEAQNIATLHERIIKVMETTQLSWELIVVDDHSNDGTYDELMRLSKADDRVTSVRLARNFGSHIAILCGLEFTSGDCTVVMASDLEDPPELIPELVAKWQEGRQVVWAARKDRRDKNLAYRYFAKLYYLFVRKFVRLDGLPKDGADFLLMDAATVSMVGQYKDKNLSLFALIAWLNLDSAMVSYTKEIRRHGNSSWNWDKRITLIVDTMVGFSHLPIKIMTIVGFAAALVGFVFGLNVVWNALFGDPPAGFSSLMVVIIFIGGIQMMMLGMLGEYLWRTLEETRNRPRYLIENVTRGKSSPDREDA